MAETKKEKKSKKGGDEQVIETSTAPVKMNAANWPLLLKVGILFVRFLFVKKFIQRTLTSSLFARTTTRPFQLAPPL